MGREVEVEPWVDRRFTLSLVERRSGSLLLMIG
jgi:hypothetical protein